jgi:hypothetical protein
VYDTQGIRDDGSDVVLRVSGNDAQGVELLGFQVKSFDDLEKEGYLQNLKAQALESLNKIKGLCKYFIVLCTDPKAHKKTIRLVESEFKTTKGTEVIEPEFAYTFFFMPKTRVEAIVKRTMEASSDVDEEELKTFGLKVLKAPVRAPQANAYCERLIGTMRRECLDFIIPLGEKHLRRLLREWVSHYNEARPHSSLGPGIPDTGGLPIPLGVASRHVVPRHSRVISRPVLGGLHHEYRLEKAAA